MNETRGNARTKPMREPLKEREMNSLKDSEKTNDRYSKGIKRKNFNPYEPILDMFEWSKPPKIIYYEVRIWKKHKIITMNVYTTLKAALNYYKRKHLKELEDNNLCYVEIVEIDNLNPRYK